MAALLALLIGFAADVDPAQATHAGGGTPATRYGERASAQFARILHVPGDYPTIQQAVDAAQSGDLVLVAPGTYAEAVRVQHGGITIRGEDRNGVVLDGGSKLSNGILVDDANNVVVENMTAHNYVGNGFYWDGVTGYRGSYLTAYDNGDYGIYAFGSTRGQFDHSYASGNPDSGFYIGECFPCDALITDVHSELNGLGYSGTNAGGNLIIRNSEWDLNGAGIAPNTLDSEGLAPQRGATITSNDVHDNGNPNAPSNASTHQGIGSGIILGGANLNYVADNRVEQNSDYGILVIGNLSKQLWLASGNVVERNTVGGSGVADLALAAPAGAGNCFADNTVGTTLPPLLQTTNACGSPLVNLSGGDLGTTLRQLKVALNTVDLAGNVSPSFHPRDWRTVPAPAPQTAMPDPSAPPAPLFPADFDPDNHSNGALPAPVHRGSSAMLAPLGSTGYSLLQLLIGLPGLSSLFALYLAWLAVALWELARRRELSGGRRLGMGALVVVVPLVGPLVYYFSGMSKLSRGARLSLVLGGVGLCLLATVLLVVASSVAAG
jgi:Right handed beta helix region